MNKKLSFPAGSHVPLLIAALAFAQTNDPSGRWMATLERGEATGQAVMTLTVVRNRVTGTLREPSGQTLEIQSGKIEGRKISFDASAREHGGEKRIHFFGDVSDDAITLQNQSNGKQGLAMTFHRVKD
jgi:hypothetical protein